MQDLQVVIERCKPWRHFLLFRAGQKPNLLGNRRCGARHDELVVLLLFENGMQSIRQCQKCLSRARWPGEDGHVDVFTIEQAHSHGLLKVAWCQPPEALIHQVVTTIDSEVHKLRVDMINIGNKFLLVVYELIRICVGQLGPRDAMQGQIALANSVNLFNARPEIVAKAFIASRQQIDIIQHSVVPVILDVREA